MNLFDFVDGILMGLLATYFFLGLFSKASWLHIDWMRTSGKMRSAFAPWYARLFCFIVFAVLAVRRFMEAFHSDANTFDITTDIVLLVGLAVLFMTDRVIQQRRKPHKDSSGG